MKAAIHNPYLDTLGGGERYTASVITVLQKAGYEVHLQWKEDSVIKSMEERFGVKLSKVQVVKDVKRGDGYDVCFWVSDGSVPRLKAKKNLLHFQVPFQGVNGDSLINKAKLSRIDSVICNSQFTKKYIDEEFGVTSEVIYPPVDLQKIKAKRKENLIIYVGRFSQLVQSKRQEVLVRSFKKFYDSGFKDWKMILAGGIEVGVGSFVKDLKKEVGDYPIERKMRNQK